MIGAVIARALGAGIVCAVLAACSPHARAAAPARPSGMGMDPFGHTRMSEARDVVPAEGLAHTQRLMAILRRDLVRYRDPAAAQRDGYRKEGEDVPVGSLKHFFKYANFGKNQYHLDPQAPAAILYRRTHDGFELAGVMFTAPISASMDELDRRVPLALGHWHSHRQHLRPAQRCAAAAHARGARAVRLRRQHHDARGVRRRRRRLSRQRLRLDDARLPVRAGARRGVLIAPPEAAPRRRS